MTEPIKVDLTPWNIVVENAYCPHRWASHSPGDIIPFYCGRVDVDQCAKELCPLKHDK